MHSVFVLLLKRHIHDLTVDLQRDDVVSRNHVSHVPAVVYHFDGAILDQNECVAIKDVDVTQLCCSIFVKGEEQLVDWPRFFIREGPAVDIAALVALLDRDQAATRCSALKGWFEELGG